MWFVSIDTETTGLDSRVHEVLEIKATALTRALQPVGEFYTKLQMLHPELASKKALEINHYNEEDWKDAPHPKDAYTSFKQWLQDMQEKIPYLAEYKHPYPIGLGQNPGFDLNFVKDNAKKHEVELRFSYHLFDIVTISMFMDIVNSIKEQFKWQESYSLSKVAEANNIATGKVHTAAADEEAHLKLLQLYIERIRDGHCTNNVTKC